MTSLDRRDWLCLAVLAVVCVVLRAPSLDRISLNPDESQYAAMASYMVASGVSPLSTAFGEPGSFAVFAGLTRLFGPYPMFEMRLLVLVVCLSVAWIAYWIVTRETNRVCGFAAGLTFLLYNLPFEGRTVNREWFALCMTAAGLALWLAVAERTDRPSHAVRFLCGVVMGFAVWFKLQAVFTLGIVPVAIVLLAVERRSLREGLRGVAGYATGVALCGVLHVIPFWAAGTLAGYVGDVRQDWRVFVLGNEAAIETAVSGSLGIYLRRLFLDLPHKPLLLATYLFCAVVVVETVSWIRRPVGPRPFTARPATIASAAWLVLAMACVQLGYRFFAHYYLLMVPAASIASGFALWWMWHEAEKRRAGRVVALLFVVAVAAEALVFARELTRIDLRSTLIALYVLGIAVALVWFALRPLARSPAAAAACLVLQVLWLGAAQGTTPTPPSMSHNRFSFDELAALLRAESRPGDRLLVWGWAPEIYALSGLTAASYVVTSEYVVRDFLAAPPRPSLDPAWVERMMRDLRATEPRFIVDASARSWTSTDMRFYRLDLYPNFAFVELLARRYEPVARVDGCVLYERRSDASPVPPGRGVP